MRDLRQVWIGDVFEELYACTLALWRGRRQKSHLLVSYLLDHVLYVSYLVPEVLYVTCIYLVLYLAFRENSVTALYATGDALDSTQRMQPSDLWEPVNYGRL